MIPYASTKAASQLREMATYPANLCRLSGWVEFARFRENLGQPIGKPVEAGLDWMDKERYDIEAQAEHSSQLDELHEMFRTLLSDRFGLRYHTETRELPTLALVVDKPRHKLRPNDNHDPLEIPMKPLGLGKVAGTGVTMKDLAGFLADQLGEIVIDSTGLNGFYDFQLEWTPDPIGLFPAPRQLPPGFTTPPNLAADIPRGPDISTAVRQQLGLNLERKKASVPVMVIEHLARPSAN
jgi:uncharacterized protein (TIGR03435 family)